MYQIALLRKCLLRLKMQGLYTLLSLCISLIYFDFNGWLISFLSHYYRFHRMSIKFPVPVIYLLPFLPKEIPFPRVPLPNHPPDPLAQAHGSAILVWWVVCLSVCLSVNVLFLNHLLVGILITK